MTDDSSKRRDPVDAAVDTIPGFRAVEAADAKLQQRIKQLRNPAALPQPDFVAEALTALDADEPLPADLGRRAWEAQQAAKFYEAELQVLLGVENRLKQKREMAFNAGADGALPMLRAALDELLAEARPAAESLRGVHDAQSAIDRGPEAIAAWQGFDAYVTRYKRIRDGQYALTLGAAGGREIHVRGRDVSFSAVFGLWSEVANVTEVWPEWVPGGEGIRPPWPVPNPNRPFDVRHDREWLLWVLRTPGVELWLPQLDELRKAWETQQSDAIERGGKAVEKTGQKLKRPVRVRAGDGSEWNEYREISA
ncbi:hypothetical protein HUT18_14000 [Streptomyces sp. NA04227]|uniref:hypothetical protein n=1 Tax=Streptomyces sp. NA04227 TaxID=2742136 RepID=UPI001590D601|nr:hypothetical protein [Streptomyces sp. NA04227]QKW07335.1 hypothetical protein HUT18_14000 [Streptomyces sp. NA04227]